MKYSSKDIRGIFQRALKSHDFSDIDKIPLNDLKLARAELSADRQFPYYILLGDKIAEKEKPHGINVSGISSNFAQNKSIFLAHRFHESQLIEKLKNAIERVGYSWEEGKRDDLGSISQDILNKIKTCGFFIALMTKLDELQNGTYTTSSWLIEEKGAALAFGHRPLLMVEQGVERHYIGFLQSDDEMIYFDRSSFDSKVNDAVNKIQNTYQRQSGDVSSDHPPSIVQPEPLDETQIAVLKTIAEKGTSGCLAEQLAEKFSMHPQRMRHYLDLLIDRNYVYARSAIRQSTTYVLATDGRAYLVTNGLI